MELTKLADVKGNINKGVRKLAQKTHVAISKQREAFNKTDGICVICGRKLREEEKYWSVDHFIPRAVYKWIPDVKTRELIESGKNIFIVHHQCNLDKDSALPTRQSINDMHADENIKNDIRELFRATEQSVIAYRSIKQSILDNQNKKCAICGKAVGFNEATLRRINNNLDRRRDNAMCLCDTCNRKAGNSRFKRWAVKKNNIKPVCSSK